MIFRRGGAVKSGKFVWLFAAALNIVQGAIGLGGCRCDGGAKSMQMTLEIRSAGFAEGAEIPQKFTCDGTNVSPALSWGAMPAKTQSVALIVRDPDAPAGTFVHWILFNLPPGADHLSEGVPKQEALADGSRQGVNDFGDVGYGGPCPPRGSTHRYFFTLYALDTKLTLAPGAREKQVSAAMKGHVLAEGQLMGRYHR